MAAAELAAPFTVAIGSVITAVMAATKTGTVGRVITAVASATRAAAARLVFAAPFVFHDALGLYRNSENGS
jgi:hypothetical protein